MELYIAEKIYAELISEKSLQMWNGAKLVSLGRCPVTETEYSFKCIMVKDELVPLVGKQAFEHMSLIAKVFLFENSSLMNEFADVYAGEMATF